MQSYSFHWRHFVYRCVLWQIKYDRETYFDKNVTSYQKTYTIEADKWGAFEPDQRDNINRRRITITGDFHLLNCMPLVAVNITCQSRIKDWLYFRCLKTNTTLNVSKLSKTNRVRKSSNYGQIVIKAKMRTYDKKMNCIGNTNFFSLIWPHYVLFCYCEIWTCLQPW